MTSLLRRARDRLELRRGALHERGLRDEYQRAVGQPELDAWFMERHGARVLHGPLAGVHYPRSTIASVHHLTAKLLGSYEEELGEVIAAQAERGPRCFVDIGSADGYYAVGFALACPGAEVHAYEIDPVARRALRALARANRVSERVHRHGPANARRLAEHDLDGAFVLSDCEGAELDVLDGPAVPALATATLLVEVHPLGDGDTGAPLRERFAATHGVTAISPRPRDPGAYRELDGAPVSLRAHAVDEVRVGGTGWLLFEPL